jgi:hypothetical protein
VNYHIRVTFHFDCVWSVNLVNTLYSGVHAFHFSAGIHSDRQKRCRSTNEKMHTNIHPSGISLGALCLYSASVVGAANISPEGDSTYSTGGHATDNASTSGDSVFTGNVCKPIVEIHRQVTEVFGDDVSTARCRSRNWWTEHPSP